MRALQLHSRTFSLWVCQNRTTTPPIPERLPSDRTVCSEKNLPLISKRMKPKASLSSFHYTHLILQPPWLVSSQLTSCLSSFPWIEHWKHTVNYHTEEALEVFLVLPWEKSDLLRLARSHAQEGNSHRICIIVLRKNILQFNWVMLHSRLFALRLYY